MKIRILGNSLRLRLSQKDLSILETEGRVAEQIQFPNGIALSYSLNSSDDERLNTQYEGTEIKTFIPKPFLEEWVKTDRVGFEGFTDLKSDEQLKILIEKDFKCLTDRGEDESSLFANPNEETC